MPIPLYTSIENPILQELAALGGRDDVRFLYERLISYFPSLSDADVAAIRNGSHNFWKKAVQRAGRSLDEQGLIARDRGFWSLTANGRAVVEEETRGLVASAAATALDALTHGEVQRLLVEIGEMLGFAAATEFEYYDVVWRETPAHPRLSHVFEVQSKGNIDSAFAKLKRAHDAQRSKIFLVLASETDTNRARLSLTREFRELAPLITIVSFPEIRRLRDNLHAIKDFLPAFLRA